MTHVRVLTGITPSGTPHLGNYVGAIKPAIEASRRPGVDSFYFLADFHALIKCAGQPERVQRSTLEIAATWLAAGLDPEHVTFYRQSDVPEIPELTWILSCVTGKGLLNRAHAYKAAVDKSVATGGEPDAAVTMGLFMYPVLMAADILMFKTNLVPVGRDQIQHIEMARDIAASFNHAYGADILVLPEAQIEDNVATLPGLDGRKMSKSYDNTLPLFAAPEELRRLINGIKTDSSAPGEPKQTEGSALYEIYQAFASGTETADLAKAYAEGVAWGEVKHVLFERIQRELAPMREKYLDLMARPADIEEILQAGGSKARRIATPLMRELRDAVGLRRLGTFAAGKKDGTAGGREARAVFKQYREADGLFYFKLVGADGDVLVQSTGFAEPREVGRIVGALKTTPTESFSRYAVHLHFPDGVDPDQVMKALQQITEE